MTQALPVASSTLLRDLHAFLALEAPFLAAKLPEDLPARELEELLLARVADRWQAGSRWGEDELWPGVTQANAARWSLDSLQELIRGFFRRHALKAAITDEQRLLMYRTMALTRAVDELLEARLRPEGDPLGRLSRRRRRASAPPGQEAIVGAALRVAAAAAGGAGSRTTTATSSRR